MPNDKGISFIFEASLFFLRVVIEELDFTSRSGTSPLWARYATMANRGDEI